MRTQRIQLGVLVLLLAALGGLLWKHQAVLDWWHLRGYTAPTAVSRLAAEDTMTAQATHLLYVNRPNITKGSAFTDHCPSGGEKTIVLGCYLGNDAGIYIYQVADARLNGVEQVTAAHEMLHAAYRRLSSSERTRVDGLLMDYYQHGLGDQRIKDTIDAYKRSEPKDVVNEMHSIFGTEIAMLPQALQQYYSRYFTDRSKVTGFAAQYDAEFTNRQYQIATDDTQFHSDEAQLTAWKAQIDANDTKIKQQNASLATQQATLNAERSSGQIGAYNAGVAAYNQALTENAELVRSTNALIDQYNALLVAAKELLTTRNLLAGELAQLTQELSASPIQTK